MTDTKAVTSAAQTAPLPTEFPADVRAVTVGASAFASGGVHDLLFTLLNPRASVLHLRLASETPWLSVLPSEVALAPEERQRVRVRVNVDAAREAAEGASVAPVGAVRVVFQRLFPMMNIAPTEEETASVAVHLPVADCPTCGNMLEMERVGETVLLPDVCPSCFERLRPCPVCQSPNTWKARVCRTNESHVVRVFPDWPALGGGPAHTGCVSSVKPALSLSRRWQSPPVARARYEEILEWSAPVAAYGLVAATAATHAGEASLYVYDAQTGAPLRTPYPLPALVHSERGGVAIHDGKIYAATFSGTVLCLDAVRDTPPQWETRLPGSRIVGAVTVAAVNGKTRLLLGGSPATETDAGCLFIVDGEKGDTLHTLPLPAHSDTAAAWDSETGLAFTHDDGGFVTAFDIAAGRQVWQAQTEDGKGFNSSPLVSGGRVFSATAGGRVLCHEARTGERVWDVRVTGQALAGTPATDGTLLYLPADDGLHLLNVQMGQPVWRFLQGKAVRSAPVVLGGSVFFGAMDGSVYGFAKNRVLETLYTSVSPVGSRFVAAPAVGENLLFLVSTNGVLYALEMGQAAG